MSSRTYDTSTNGWDQLLVRVKAHAADLPFLDSARKELAVVVRELREAKTRQTALEAQYRKASREVRERMARGRDLATRLRNGIRSRYGLTNDKLTDFEINPRRPKTRPRK